MNPSSPNLSSPDSNDNYIDQFLRVMETDFLNFHDEEHFGTGLYQNELLDDSQSSLLDMVRDDYSRQDSSEYDHSHLWEQDVERELNGDVAVIPMSSQIDTFPKLSNSPPSKDFQKIFTDWQHLTAIETTSNEDLTADLHLPATNLVNDMLDCFNPSNITIPATSSISQSIVQPKIEQHVDIIPSFDFSNTTIPEVKPSFESETKFKKKDIAAKPVVRKMGGKNLELLKQVVKEDIDLDTSFKSELNSSDELDSANDSFDITTYVNGDDDLLQNFQEQEEKNDDADDEEKEEEVVEQPVVVKDEKLYARKYGGCYEKKFPDEQDDNNEPEIKEEIVEDKKRNLHEDSEEDNIDVETVSEQMPVLQARDLTSLLEQFEASEAVNPKLPQNLFEEKVEIVKPEKNQQTKPADLIKSNVKITTETKSTSENHLLGSKQKYSIIESKNKVNSELKSLKNTFNKQQNKTIHDSLPIDLIQKIKASGTKKQISVIPAMPTKKARCRQENKTKQQQQQQKMIVQLQNCANESFQLDHDYCTISPAKINQTRSRRNSSDSENHIKKFNSPDRNFCTIRKEKCDNKIEYFKKQTDNSGDNEDACKIKKNIGNLIDDTAIRIGKQIKNAINNENALKQKLILSRSQESLLKNQPTSKHPAGKLMVSLLKTNNRNNPNLMNKVHGGNTIINTINTNDEQIQNIIVADDSNRNCKKRKLNLEEYKKLRGDIIKLSSCENSLNNSPGNSGNNSPMPEKPIEEKYQEVMMKMASEILKTNAKSKSTISDATLEEFVLPNAQKSVKKEDKIDEKLEDSTQMSPQKVAENYKIKTIVSIGVNTDDSFLKSQTNDSKISFKLSKKKEIQRNKFFDTKSSESEDGCPKKDTNVNKSKLSEIITPILQNASSKINSNSLITNITATLLQQTPKMVQKSENTENVSKSNLEKNEPIEHGEDKTVIILNKNDEKPETKTIGIQTDNVSNNEENVKEKSARQYRSRRDSSTSSTASISSLKTKNSCSNSVRKGSHRQSHRTSSSNSISSSLGSRWSRSRSRSRSRSSSHSDYTQSSYSSSSSRSKSRSVSPSRRWHSDRTSRSRHRYNRSRRRSRSNYRDRNYRRSRSPYSRSRSRLRRERESAERERMREVEERRVVYVGKINDDATKADLRRRFQSFGPITNVSVHFRDHGDNYGFVTFAYKMDAYDAVERGNDDPYMPKYDISFGGRRAFCKTKYSDLDNIEAEAMNSTPIFRREEDSFDILLREVQAKLRKRKV